MRVTQQGAFVMKIFPALKVNLINPYYDHFPGKKVTGIRAQVGLAYLLCRPNGRSDAQSPYRPMRPNLDDERLLADLAQNCPTSSLYSAPSLCAGRTDRRTNQECFSRGADRSGRTAYLRTPQDLPAAIDLGVLGEGEATFAES
jgi:hypothetical protein